MIKGTRKSLKLSKIYTQVSRFTSCFGIRIIILHETCFADDIACVRWDLSGKSLASASFDETAKVLDFASGKIAYSGNTIDGSKYLLLILLFI